MAKNKYTQALKKREKTTDQLLKKTIPFLENKVSVLDKKIKANQKENNVLYNKMSLALDVLGYKIKREAEAKGFKEGAEIRIKATNELPKHLRKRREEDFWKVFDIRGTYNINITYFTNNTGRPHIDKDKPELIINVFPPLRRKDGGNQGGISPIIRLTDIELVK